MKKLSDKQKLALAKLEEALKACSKVGISLHGMDDSIIYATKSAIAGLKNVGNDGSYTDVPAAFQQFHSESDCTGEVKDFGAYVDSGGW